MDRTGVPKHRVLPDKEGKLFRELLTQYELKQYKKGLKAADQILKKFPNHGETLALKALTIHSSLPMTITVGSAPKQQEAEEMARLAIRKDMTSHITWHVLGIMAKSRKDWTEATKAFAQARRIDMDNLPLIRDAMSLYLHTRQYEQALAARHHYLLLRPQIRSSWIGLMVAHDLCGDYQEAISVYDDYCTTMQTDSSTAQEKAQIALYVVKVCIRAKMWAEALKRLERDLSLRITSPVGEITHLKAEILIQLDRKEDAHAVFEELLRQNPDNLEYYRGYLRTIDLDIASPELSDESRAAVLSELAELARVFPKSPAPRRLALNVAQGEAFRERVRAYLIDALDRGIPSLFVDVKGLYVDSTKSAIVGEVIEKLVKTLEDGSGIHGDDTLSPPIALVWAYYFLALHLSYPRNPSPAYARSLDLLEFAIRHTPTLPEVYMAKAMILKRAGNPLAAAEAMEEARLLDGQDRFLNSKAAKYWLRAGEIKRAEELLGLFIGGNQEPAKYLAEYQGWWALQESGDAFRRKGDVGMALKRYNAIIATFQEYDDDQYDFHTYCMRRMTLSAYTSLMKYEDTIRAHPAYIQGATAAIELYLALYDDPSIAEEKLTEEEEAERKKAAKKAHKAEFKAKKAAAAAGGDQTKKEDQPLPDADPDGKVLAKTDKPLEEALKLFEPLEKVAAGRIETWTLAYEIDIRRKKYVGALKCLLEAAAIDPEHPVLHRQILHFRRTSSATTDIPSPVKSAIDQLFPSLFPAAISAEALNDDYLSRHPHSAPHILGAAEGALEIKRATSPLPEDTASSVFAVLEKLAEKEASSDLQTCSKALEVLKRAGGTVDHIDSLRLKLKGRYPLASIFDSRAEQAVRTSNGVNGEHGDVKPDV